MSFYQQLNHIEELLIEIRDALKPRPLPAVPYEQVAAMMDAPPYDPLAGLRKAAREREAAKTVNFGMGVVGMGTPEWFSDPMQQIAHFDDPALDALMHNQGAWFDEPTEQVEPYETQTQAMQSVALPPARPAGSLHSVNDLPDEPDLDTALTMGMEAPAPVVLPTRAGPASLYPRTDLTPGVVFPQITSDDVSVPGYAKRVRAVPDAMKRAVYLRYGLDPSKHEQAEVDHYVSLCLGGTNDIENLWPEPAVTPDAPGGVGFREKDACEFWLHQQVCNKSMTLQQAQDQIRGDWFACFISIPHSHLAMMSAMLDAPEQP